MILRLVREQLRSQWRYTAWSAGLLAFALALATYAMVTGATAIAQQDANTEFAGKDHAAFFVSAFGGDVDPALDVYGYRLPFDDVQAMIDQASGETSVDAVVSVVATAEGSPDWLSVAATAKPLRWERYLVSGHAPAHGEVAVGYSVARALDVGVGDTITLHAVDTRGPARSMTFVISGILKSGTVGPYWSYLPADIYVPWSDARDIALGLPTWRVTDDATGVVTTLVTTVITWDGDSGTLAPYDDLDYEPGLTTAGFSLVTAVQFTDQPGYWSLTAAGLAVVGMIIAAFGMGRAQAEARTRWAATARVLGATRRTIAFSSLIETAVVSLVGIAAGLVAGIAAVAVNIRFLRWRHPEALLPSGPSVPVMLIAAGIGIGLVIAGVVATVPAFWTARVAPVAALKPVTPVGEATVSRDVSPWWPLGIYAGAGLLWSVLFWVYERGERSDTDVISVVMWVTFVAFLVSSAALALEGSRRLVGWVGGFLSRSHRPWAIAAGDGLVAHRRTYTFASLSSLALTAFFAWAATTSATGAFDPFAPYRGWGEPPLPSLVDWWNDDFQASGRAAGFGLIIGVATVVAVAVTLASRATFATDAATRTALGLSGTGERIAAWARQWAVMSSAAVIGGLLGWAARLVIRLGGAALSPNELAYSPRWNLTVAVYGLVGTALMIAVALGMTLAGSLVVGLLTRAGTPVETLRRSVG